MKKSYKNNEFEISGLTWDEEFELPNGSYFVLDVQSYFDYAIKKHETLTDSPPIQIYINRIENRIKLRIKAGYCLELSMPEKTKLLGSSEKKITKHENGENVPRLEVTEVLLFKCNLVNNACLHDSSVLYTFAPNKSNLRVWSIFHSFNIYIVRNSHANTLLC